MRENYFLIQILLARGKYDQKSAEEETGNTTRGKDMLSAFHGGRKLQRKEILKKFLVEIQSYRTTTRGKRTVSSSGVWCGQRTPYNTDWTHLLILGLTPPCRHSEAKYPLCHRPTVPPLFWRSKGWILTLLIPKRYKWSRTPGQGLGLVARLVSGFLTLFWFVSLDPAAPQKRLIHVLTWNSSNLIENIFFQVVLN